MSCEHEHHDHGGHDGHDHSHDVDPALQSNLYKQIQFDKIRTLNEIESKSGAAIVQKEWRERLSDTPVVESDADEQLLMHIPFTSSCKLYSLIIRTSDTPHAPRKLKLFRNRDDLDFGTASDLNPTQTVNLPRSNEAAEIPLNRARWNTTTAIDLFFEDNHSDGDEDMTHVFYLGFKGDWMAVNREAIHVSYEAAANPKDHTVIQGLENQGQQSLGQ